MKRLLKLLILILILSGSQQLIAQEDDNSGSWDLGVDLMSRYVWRGFDFGAMPSIQPGLTYTKGGLEIGVWGAYAMNFSGYQETDLYFSYTFMKDKLSLGITDYFFPDIAALDQGYFDWSESTGHCVEFNANFNGFESFPLTVSINTFVHGADQIFSDSSLNSSTGLYEYNSKANFSTYVELGYSFEADDVALDVFAGYQLNGINIEDAIIDGGEGFYLDGPGLINVGLTASKEIEINEKWVLPVTSSFILNPKRQRVYFVFGFTF